MTISTSQITLQWGDRLLREIAALERRFDASRHLLASRNCEDFARLMAAGARLRELLHDQPAATDSHELMNILGALRGYAEMLRDDIGDAHPALRHDLGVLLEAVQPGGNARPANDVPAQASAGEPGFILAVDDQQENRELVARSLSRAGHLVVTAADGEEALAVLAQSDVDVVLLDLLMPGMDGRDVLRRIKEHPEWRATPVIVISGSQDMDRIIECIEAGADDYLFKPFNPVLLQARIKAGIDRKRWHDREEQYRRQLERNERFIRATFGRYLSDDIVNDILERPEGLQLGGDLRRVSIMMSDIRGFTTLSEHLAPDQVVTLLNRYLGAMTDIIMAHQGTIDEFIGDAILAVFGAPRSCGEDADRAVRCALAMQAAMAGINERNRAEGLPELSTGIAINTGDVIAGNIGSERRSKYGFVGHPMNVTSRIEGQTAGGEILISDSTLSALTGHYRLTGSREIQVKGIEESILVHRVAGDAT